ncbi:MAG TPA: HAD-IC family P-type ATPase, partial [Candidatus Nanoarchaeia archaeon]|nr:HAD-IC family P-type ATPase [Candidatus Nanoarchaeia archaeon]
MDSYYQLGEKEVLRLLASSETGLSSGEAKDRLEKHGLNELVKKRRTSIFKLLLNQLRSIVVYILLAALAISILTDQFLDATVIGAILILNTLLGFIQEFKAEKSIEALQRLSTPLCNVMRDGKIVTMPSNLLVPGDVILLEAGNRIPADCYLLEAFNLKVDESALTGESVPSKKNVSMINKILPVSEQSNLVFSATTAVYGRAKAIVIRTGMSTEIGKIADLVQQEKQHETPLQHKLEKFGTILGIATILISALILVEGLLEGQPLFDMFLVAVSLAVAAIPEGLPAVVTICLAIGVKTMVRKNVLIRKLSSVETLGSTTIICSDKTGTLTCNQMTVEKIYAENMMIDVTGLGYEKKGQFLSNGKQFDTSRIAKLIETGFLCNDSKVNDDLTIIGDPTEASLVVLAGKAGIINDYKRIDEIPFSSEAKFMATINEIEGKAIMHVKGASEVILSKCSHYQYRNSIKPLTIEMKKKILAMNDAMANDTLRILALAYGKTSKPSNLIFLGLVGMIDPPRPDVQKSIQLCKHAGIKVVMITGDHKITAQAIAKQIGLGTSCMTGEEIEQMDYDEFRIAARKIDIFARVSPEHKVKILDALKPGNVVAMTGDGVNDAPALKKADIGVAVGSATDVAKEAADMVLLDDHFNSIVNAVKEGRGIYDNIKKFINYMLSSNMAEILILFIAMLLDFKDPSGNIVLPLLALQILWINLVTDGLPALALGADPISESVMDRPPRKTDESIISKNMGVT